MYEGKTRKITCAK